MGRKSKRKGQQLGTRIITCKSVDPDDYEKLSGMAHKLGVLRSEIWNEFGSLKGLGLKHEAIRDQWLAEGRDFNVPARLWKETLADTMGDIKAYREAAKVEVQACIRR